MLTYDGRLHPLLGDQMCKAMLPIANRPMLYYCLQMIESAGISQIIVIAQPDDAEPISNYLSKVYEHQRTETRIEMRTTTGDSADAIRVAKELITADFLVMSCDVMTNMPLLPLVDQFRLHRPTVAVLLSELPRLETSSAQVDKHTLKSTFRMRWCV